MPPDPAEPPAVAHSLWTIARIHNALANPILVRRFLRDLTHAPEHEVMNVFTAWRRVAATMETRAYEAGASEAVAVPRQLPASAPE